ncbi:MAG: 4Fe-4S binding protein [Oscillospiraceae bacterium]|nr:4Fe-4S binding protein [Oscillospiraceae bacterium]
MKKLSVKKGIECMACMTCANVCSNMWFKTEDSQKACLSIGMKGEEVVPSVCIQCGKCAKNCPEGAITQNPKGVYMINKKLCKGCGKCVEVCPFHVIVMPEGAEAPTKCIACGQCAKVCPMEMLEIIEK